MLVYTRRSGHEAEGWYDSTEADIGSGRRLPDPINHDSTNILGKVDFVLGPAHRLGLVYERNRVENLVDNLSRVSPRSEEHTSELQSLMRISYAVFCLKKKT